MKCQPYGDAFQVTGVVIGSGTGSRTGEHGAYEIIGVVVVVKERGLRAAGRFVVIAVAFRRYRSSAAPRPEIIESTLGTLEVCSPGVTPKVRSLAS